MRRLTLAAICGQAVTAPRCRPTPFPVLSLTTQIIKIFPVTGGLQANALVRMAAIWILIGDAGGEDETCYGIFLPLSTGGTVIVP